MKKLIPVIIFFLLVFIAGYIQHNDSDLYGHFAMGRVIAQQGIPHHEVMSQAGPSRPYIPTEWLFQIFLYWFLTIFGFQSYHLFNAIFTTINVFVFFMLLKKIFKVNQLFSLLLSASYAILNYQFFVQRPQVFADTFLLLELIILLKYLLQNKNYLYFLLPIIYLWENLHASFILGILLCIAYCLLCFLGIFTKNRNFWVRKSGILGLYSVGLFIVTLLPPQFFSVYSDLFTMYKYNYIMSVVNNEWLPLYKNITFLIFYSVFALASLIFFIFIVIKKKLFKKVLWLLPIWVFIPYTYFSIRNLYYGYLTITLITGWTLANITIHKWNYAKKTISFIVIAIVLGSEFWLTFSIYQNSYFKTPVHAADFILQNNIQGNMFNEFGIGDYLEYRLYPLKKVFMDGRAEPFFCCEMKDYYLLEINSSRPIQQYRQIFNGIFNKYHFSYAILGTGKGSSGGIIISNMLEKNPLWFLVYKDNLNEIWVKKDGKNTELLNKLTSNQIKQPASSDTKIFSSVGMNLTFSYPKTLTLTQINPSLISLSNPSKKVGDTSLYIYSTVVDAKATNYKIPFVLPGKLKSEARVPLRGFIAIQEIYSDGKKEADFLILRNGQQLIVLRIPQNSKPVADAITDFADTIKTLH